MDSQKIKQVSTTGVFVGLTMTFGGLALGHALQLVKPR